MPFVTISDPRYTDVILEEEENLASRQIITVTPSTATGSYPAGTILFRAKALDDTAAWDVMDAGAEVALANEYAILIGNSNKPTESVTLTTAVPNTVIAITSRARVKESAIKAPAIHAALSGTNWTNLKGILRKQQFIKVEDSLTAV